MGSRESRQKRSLPTRGLPYQHSSEEREILDMTVSAPPGPKHAPAHQVIVAPVPPLPRARRRHSSWLKDVVRGAALGDFATELHVPGAVTHAVLGFVPGLGTLL